MASLTTRRAAEALGVSESSLKRWCDQGELDFSRTAGGHRRLEARTLIAFAKNRGQQLARPDLLGLFPRRGPSAARVEISARAFCDALLRGDEAGCRFVARTCFLAGQSLAEFGDQFVAAAFRDIGERWAHGDAEVYQERRACQICQTILGELSTLLPESRNGPVAIGGTLAGDPYSLSASLAALVLRQNGWRAQSLGTGLPWETLAAAVRDLRPKLFWLSFSTLDTGEDFLEQYRQLQRAIGGQTAIVVGGRALTPELRTQMNYAAYCDNLQHIESFARSLHRPRTTAKKER